ncbi:MULTISPECIES: YqzL family protein [Gracilibacillus]|nr:YqzL family protein [Gracilibacillus timonensis]
MDVPWKVFSQTGNIEAYLWMKEVEADDIDEEEGEEPIIEDRHL